MWIAVGLVVLATVVLAVTAASRRWNLPAPLVLLVVGAAGSWLPYLPEIHLDPEVVLLGVLPPLLYTAAIQTSAIDFRRDARSIAMLSVLLVAVTAAVVGVVASALLQIPYAAGFALGAVVAPPDAVAATAVAKRVGLPRRLVSILEGESLVNDATAITCLRVAIVAIGGTVSAVEIGGLFLLATAGGVAIGLVVALVFSLVRRHVVNPIFDTACSLLIPFVAYLPAEAVHSSGVVAVVTAGIVLGHRSPIIQTAESRVTERITWRTVQFLLENTVFLLIGLQSRWIIADVLRPGGGGLGLALGVAAAVLATVMVVRLVWLLATRYVLGRSRVLDRASTVIIGWAGMRGVVTLAAAQLLPEDLEHREVLIFVALVVTVGTLLVQGLTLGPLATRLGTRGPDAREDTLRVAHVLQKLGNRSIARLADLPGDDDTKSLVIDRIRARANAVWEQLGQETATPAEEYRRLRLATLAGEREDLLAWRAKGGRRAEPGQELVDQTVLAEVLAQLDEEEATLGRSGPHLDPVEAEPLTVRARAAGSCADLAAAPEDAVPISQECLRCIEDGTRPVSLRLCLTCGNVGCCDSSVGQHATEHFHTTGHPVMRSFEPGENWRWCYVHERLG